MIMLILRIQIRFQTAGIGCKRIIPAKKRDEKNPLWTGKDNVFNPNLFCGWHAGKWESDFFPRMLSLKANSDPYVVFKRFLKFLSLAEGKRDLIELLENALVTISFLISAIALAGLKPLGQVLAQFMMVWQR